MDHCRHGRKFIVKGLRPDLRDKPEYRAMLFKEFELGMKLDHPCVVRTWGWEERKDKGPCVVMEFIDGFTLGEWIEKTGPSGAKRLDVATQLVSAIAYMHSAGVCHRDLKPDNIIITRSGSNVKLIDFGLSDSDEFAILKKSAATRSYGAPEQLEGCVGDARSDIYALGAILRQLCPGVFYGRLVRDCMRQSPVKRPPVEAVQKRMMRIADWQRRAPWLVAGGLICMSAVAIYFLRPQEPVADAETVAPVADTVVVVRTVRDTVLLPSEPQPSPVMEVENEARPQPRVEIVDNPAADDLFEALCSEMEAVVATYKGKAEKEPDNMAKMNLYTERNQKLTSMVDGFKKRLADIHVRQSHISQYESTFWYQVAKLSN